MPDTVLADTVLLEVILRTEDDREVGHQLASFRLLVIDDPASMVGPLVLENAYEVKFAKLDADAFIVMATLRTPERHAHIIDVPLFGEGGNQGLHLTCGLTPALRSQSLRICYGTPLEAVSAEPDYLAEAQQEVEDMLNGKNP